MLWFKKKEERAQITDDDPLFRTLLSGDTVTKEMALQVPTVSGGIDLIANIIASTPIKLYRDTGGKAEEIIKDYRLRLLNEDPGDTLTAYEFWQAIIRDYYLGKGGYFYINWQGNRINSLHYVDEEYISVIRSYDPIFKDYDILVHGRRYRPYEFFRILRNTKDGAEGVPVTAESSQIIAVAYNSLKFELNMAKRGGNKRGFLRSEKKLAPDVLAKLREAFRKLYSGSGEDNFVVLNEGIDFKESSSTSAEMQMNENKVTNAAEFAKIFHISTDVMAGKATDADIASLARLAAIPLMAVIESSLNRNMLLEKEKDEYYFAFDKKELLKGDMVSRFNAYKIALDSNFMQVDEVRYREDLDPLGFNMIKLGLQDVLYDPVNKTLITPNTGQVLALGDGGLNNPATDDKIEPRANPNHDPKTGKFTNGRGSTTAKKKKTKYAPTHNYKKSTGVKMSKKKYTQLSGKVATAHPEWTSGIHTFYDANVGYRLEAHSFGEYTFTKKFKLK